MEKASSAEPVKAILFLISLSILNLPLGFPQHLPNSQISFLQPPISTEFPGLCLFSPFVCQLCFSICYQLRPRLAILFPRAFCILLPHPSSNIVLPLQFLFSIDFYLLPTQLLWHLDHRGLLSLVKLSSRFHQQL